METLHEILRITIFVIGAMASYMVIFPFIGFLLPSKKFKETDKRHKFAILVAANNEEQVIAQLVESVKKQDYPSELIAVFVCADMCTDKTAQVARAAGAIVYERKSPKSNEKKKLKAYALKYMLEQISKDYPEGIETWDGAIILDADNILNTDYVTEFNKALANKKYDFFTSYINAKNMDASFSASFHGVGCYSTMVTTQRPLSHLGVSQPSRGRGMLYRTHLLAKGWNWCSLAEDAYSSANFISKGYRSSYCEAAKMYDECPLTLKIVVRQRMRWAKGKWIAFWRYCLPLAIGIVYPKDWSNKKPKTLEKQKPTILSEIQKRLSCYHYFVALIPLAFLTFIMTIIYPIVSIIMGYSLTKVAIELGIYYALLYGSYIGRQFVTIVREHQFMRINPWKLLWHVFVWGFVEIALQFIRFWAILTPVKWKKIPHVDGKSIDAMQSEKTLADYIYKK